MANQSGEPPLNPNPTNPSNNNENNQEVDQPLARSRRALARPSGDGGGLNLSLQLGTPDAGPSDVQPQQQYIWPHPQRRANDQWRCPVCRNPFYNMRALCGHMNVHKKDRNWRGIYPPAELCKRLGLDHVTDISAEKGKNDLGRNNPTLSGPGIGVACGGGSSGAGFPRLPPTNFNNLAGYTAVGAAAGGTRVEFGRDRLRNLHRRRDPTEEETWEAPRNLRIRRDLVEDETSELPRKKLRSEGEPLLDLNSLPPNDGPDGGESGCDGGTAV